MIKKDSFTINALPSPVEIDLLQSAIVMIDMQRDFLEPGGFGEALGNDVSQLKTVINSCQTLLEWGRKMELLIIHTREGHSPDLNDLPREKHMRGLPGKRIGDVGPMGRILVKGEPGHDFIDTLYPHKDEVIIDKPGKGAFYNTDLQEHLDNNRISTLLICGVTTEVCVQSTVREANDRGYRVIVPEDCCGSYFPEFHRAAIKMVTAQGGIFGYTCLSGQLYLQ